MTRETLKCPSCGLNQFVNAAETCKRCKEPIRITGAPAPPKKIGRPIAHRRKPEPITEIRPALAAELMRLRTTAGMSQSVLCARMDRPRSYISKCEHARTQPTVASLMIFAEALNIPAWQILKNAEEAMHKEAR